jgi:hypothetical protein
MKGQKSGIPQPLIELRHRRSSIMKRLQVAGLA